MQELIKHAYNEFDVNEDEIIMETIRSSTPLILPCADHDLAFDSIEKTLNASEIDNDMPRNLYAFNATYEPVDKSLPSYFLIINTSHTVDSTFNILKVDWI